MQAPESYEWLLESCLQECRKGIAHLERIAATSNSQRPDWLQQDIADLLELEAAALHSFATLRRMADPAPATRELTQERLDRLQTRLLESFQHLATQGLSVSRCT
jgi:hypothetical protein